MVFGICWSAVEKYMNLPFFYCWANNWGDSGLGGIAMIVVYQGQRFFISHKRELEEQKYLWELYIAQEDFDFQGKVMIRQ